MARILKFGSTQIGDELVSFRQNLERSNKAVHVLQDSNLVHVESTSPGFVYQSVAVVIVEKGSDDLFEAYVNGTLLPALIAQNIGTAAEWETSPSPSLKRSQANARFDGIAFTPVPQKSLGAHDYGIQISFVSSSPIAEAT